MAIKEKSLAGHTHLSVGFMSPFFEERLTVRGQNQGPKKELYIDIFTYIKYMFLSSKSVFLARFGMGRSFAKNLNLCVQTEKKE